MPIFIGGIEASLRPIAQYDYWSNEVKRSVLVDSGADMLAYGNAERALAELAHRIAAGESITTVDNIRGTVVVKPAVAGAGPRSTPHGSIGPK